MTKLPSRTKNRGGGFYDAYCRMTNYDVKYLLRMTSYDKVK